MKSKILTTGLLIGFLVGCTETHQNTIDYSKREPSQAPTVKIIKPSPSTTSKATEIVEPVDHSTKSSPQKLNKDRNQEEIFKKLLRLTKTQTRQIFSLDGLPIVTYMGERKLFKVILPKYIPEGFELSDFEVRINQPLYSLLYMNQKKQCFTISGWMPGAGSPTVTNPIMMVKSINAGIIEIRYNEFDREISSSTMEARLPEKHIFKTGVYYGISSPAAGGVFGEKVTCNSVVLQEVIKIAKSSIYIKLY